MAYRVFISYSTHDLDLVDHLRAMLENPSVRTFAAEYSVSIGGELAPEIKQAICDCDLFLLLWSQAARRSDWVPQEIGIAVSQEKNIIPVVLEPDLPVSGFIEGVKYLEAHTDPVQAMHQIRQRVFAEAGRKQRINGYTGLAIGGALLWLLTQGDPPDDDDDKDS